MKKAHVILAVFVLALFLLWIGGSCFLNGQKVMKKKITQSAIDNQAKKSSTKPAVPAPAIKGSKIKK
jgi:hypothetical protein